MTSIIEKINQSRYNLKKYLADEWDVSTIPNYSASEIESLYTINAPKNPDILSFGQASGCNFSVKHKLIPMHSLHVIYYNFPELDKKPLKITKNICDKITEIYKTDLFQDEDSILIITCEKVSEGLQKAFEDLYHKYQEELVDMFSLELENENRKLPDNLELRKSHFKNCHIFHLDTLSIDILEHRLVPPHKVIRNNVEINKILERCNCTFKQLPIIKRDDAIGKVLRIAPGDICEITRINDNSCESTYYRGCH